MTHHAYGICQHADVYLILTQCYRNQNKQLFRKKVNLNKSEIQSQSLDIKQEFLRVNRGLGLGVEGHQVGYLCFVDLIRKRKT